MGVNIHCRLPSHTRVRDVALVIGAVVGMPIVREETDLVMAPDARVETTSVPEMVYITFEDRHAAYFFEDEDHDGRLFYPRSTPFWCAVAHRLVEFFGGEVDYNDCDDSSCDFKAKANRRSTTEVMREVLTIKPLTRDEIATFKQVAGYPSDSYIYKFDANGHMTYRTAI